MPTYEYACAKCGYHFDKFQSMRDEPLKKCPKCNKAALKRLVGGGAGLIFKGSGFYITDYRKKGQGKPEGAEPKAAESKAGPESKAGADSKPAGESKPAASPAGGGAKATPAPAAPSEK
jgi:putative FmdB family regulatory protein